MFSHWFIMLRIILIFWVCSLKGYIFINVLLQHQKRIIFYHTIIAQSKVEQWNINVLKFIDLYERRERQKMCSLIRKDIMTRINGKIYFLIWVIKSKFHLTLQFVIPRGDISNLYLEYYVISLNASIVCKVNMVELLNNNG
jgi:hypothetical protein